MMEENPSDLDPNGVQSRRPRLDPRLLNEDEPPKDKLTSPRVTFLFAWGFWFMAALPAVFVPFGKLSTYATMSGYVISAIGLYSRPRIILA